MREKASSKFSSRYSLGNPRCTAYICTTVTNWASYPRSSSPRINRPELERIWKDTEKILAEHAFVHDHKFPSLQAIVDYRMVLSRQIETLAAQRAEIVKQMRRKDASPELADQRMALTCKITELRKEDKIAEGAIKRIQRTRESNRIEQENRNQHTNNKTHSRDSSRRR